MHPQTFLNTFWRLELFPQVFVAMSFSPQYQSRFDRVIEPSIRSISVDGVPLTPRRVDISKTGDSIPIGSDQRMTLIYLSKVVNQERN